MSMQDHDLQDKVNQYRYGERWFAYDNCRNFYGKTKAEVLRNAEKPEQWFNTEGVLSKLADEIAFCVVGENNYILYGILGRILCVAGRKQR